MINLIKNEMIKLFKKKSIYIIFIITILYMILVNFISKFIDNDLLTSSMPSMLTFYETELSQMTPDIPGYADIKAEYETLKLGEKYGFDSWQYAIINQELSGFIHMINDYEYSSVSLNKEDYEYAKKQYEEIVGMLDTNDWTYFAKKELTDITDIIDSFNSSQVENIDNNNDLELKDIELKKQTIEWRLQNDISYAPSFLNSCIDNYYYFGSQINSYLQYDNPSYMEKLDYYQALKNFHINKYYLENNIKNITDNDTRAILLDLFGYYELFILIFAIMIAGTMISEEFNKGTIKLLLVRPYSRLKILFAKFIVCIIMLVLFIALVSFTQLIIGGLIHGFNSLSVPAVTYNYTTNQIETMSIFKYIVIQAIAKLPLYILLLTLAFTCSTIFLNTALAITLPLLGYIGYPIINQVALAYDLKPVLYFVTPNWDFTQYLFGAIPNFEGLTVPVSIAVCLVYFIIMLVISSITFKRRNIKNI